MLSNLSDIENEPVSDYAISDSSRPFHDYIAKTREIIIKRRPHKVPAGTSFDQVVAANCPFELYPTNPVQVGNKLKYGALLIHGLLDCPFSLKDIGHQLQSQGILSRSILLPGHGTTPSDLLRVSYHDWIQAVRYGVETLRNEVEEIYLVGYSTGAALSVYQALQDIKVSGIILLSPAIKIKAPVDIMVGWQYLSKKIRGENKEWLYIEPEDDYAKYQSIPFNAVNQVSNLTKVIQELREHRALNTPMYMVVSREDETISSDRAIEYFSSMRNSESRLLLYTSVDHAYPDPRIQIRLTNYHELKINHISHTAIPFAPTNAHYGMAGDYEYASKVDQKDVIFGAYNTMEENLLGLAYKSGLARNQYRRLTYNPDFTFMAEKISQFIQSKHES